MLKAFFFYPKAIGEVKMLMGPSDMYGDLDLEDVDEFEGLESDDCHEVDPLGRFQRNEFRKFDEDFEHEMEDSEEEDYWQDQDLYYDDRLLEDEEGPYVEDEIGDEEV